MDDGDGGTAEITVGFDVTALPAPPPVKDEGDVKPLFWIENDPALLVPDVEVSPPITQTEPAPVAPAKTAQVEAVAEVPIAAAPEALAESPSATSPTGGFDMATLLWLAYFGGLVLLIAGKRHNRDEE